MPVRILSSTGTVYTSKSMGGGIVRVTSHIFVCANGEVRVRHMVGATSDERARDVERAVTWRVTRDWARFKAPWTAGRWAHYLAVGTPIDVEDEFERMTQGLCETAGDRERASVNA